MAVRSAKEKRLMDEHYCPMCGKFHGGEAEAEAVAEIATAAEVTSAEVRIAEINAERDVKLARIAAGVIDAERDTDLARAEGKADALEQIVTPPPEPAPDPIIIDAPEAIADDAPDDAPPEVGDGSPPPAPQRKARGLGAW
jgi:hypothetical protein